MRGLPRRRSAGRDPADGLPVSDAVDLYFYRFRPLTRRKAQLVIVHANPSTTNRLPTMVQQPAHSIIAELEDAVRGGSSAKRVETLRQVTDLFLNDGERLSTTRARSSTISSAF